MTFYMAGPAVIAGLLGAVLSGGVMSLAVAMAGVAAFALGSFRIGPDLVLLPVGLGAAVAGTFTLVVKAAAPRTRRLTTAIGSALTVVFLTLVIVVLIVRSIN